MQTADGQGILRRECQLLQAEAARLRERIAHAEKAQSDFLSIVSHELRTPLTSIVGFLDLLSSGVARTPEEQGEFLASALESAHELKRTINDLLEMAELESGETSFLLGPFDLTSVARTEFLRYREQAKARGLEMRFSEPPESLPLVRADAQRVQTVLRHVLANAFKFTATGQISIHFRLDPERPLLRMEVADTGIGFPPEMQERILKMFRQEENPSTRQHGGLGIGLTISSRFMKAMGGDFEIVSEGRGRGARATLTLPLDPSFSVESSRSLAESLA